MASYRGKGLREESGEALTASDNSRLWSLPVPLLLVAPYTSIPDISTGFFDSGSLFLAFSHCLLTFQPKKKKVPELVHSCSGFQIFVAFHLLSCFLCPLSFVLCVGLSLSCFTIIVVVEAKVNKYVSLVHCSIQSCSLLYSTHEFIQRADPFLILSTKYDVFLLNIYLMKSL